ncbi:MAG: thiamine phosphate synthase [Propionibacteriales bacterium]|nr:thiamine phosphate synthase [Propionibacteriales bacterium]
MSTPGIGVLPRLVLLTDRSLLPLGRSLRSALEECADAGLTHVVVRELDLSDAQRADLVDHLAALGLVVVAARRSIRGAVGVHLAAHQSAASGSWGRSCHSAADVRRAASDGASWVTLSPFGATESKPGHGPPLSREQFTGHDIPVLALGGVTTANAADARAAGAYGVAVMGSVLRATEPAAVVVDLLRAVAP